MHLKQKFNHSLYFLAKKALFKLEPETAHNFTVKTGKTLTRSKLARKTLSSLYGYENQLLEQTILGINFKNPVGLSAGFDKNAELMDLMGSIGFGFVEVGSITSHPSSGNKGKRLDRIPEKKAIWVNLGLNNEGAAKIKSKLFKKFDIPIGISIAKTNCKETADDQAGLLDYIEGIKTLKDIGDYLTINISCPNAYGGQPFSNPKLLKQLLKNIPKQKKPVFIKLSPDLDKKTLDNIISISLKNNIQGFICTNLTKNHNKKTGGLSGKYVLERANSLLSYVYSITKNKNPRPILIGTGGISSAEDAYNKIKLGANLVQLITGMIYEGPHLIGEINQGLVHLLNKDNFQNISQAVGSAQSL